ncbi:MAG TPA: cytochrome P450 [Thermoleophilaceae bacterium]
MTLPPGPRMPAALQAGLMTRDPVGWLEQRRARYGDVFSSRFPFIGSLVYVSDPAEIKRVFSGDVEVFHAGEANSIPLGPVFGTYSLLTLDEDEHMAQRKLLLPPFHGEAVRRYGEEIERITDRELDRWPIGEPFQLRPAMQAITLQVILRTVFGVADHQVDAFSKAITLVAQTGNALIWFPPLRREFGRFSPAARFRRVREAADALIHEQIDSRRALPEEERGDDVLSVLLSARHDDGTPMTNEELRDELMTLLGAGHETSATGLSWALERLVRNPAALDRLVADPDDDAYLDAVIKETLRVRPVITDVARKLTRDTDVGGYTVPAGTIVLAVIALAQRSADLWPDPKAFRPERFLEGQPEPYSWIPFGGGVRRCIGAAFAQYEMKVVLRTIMRRARFRRELARSERGVLRHVTVVPARGARVVMDERLPSGEPGGQEQVARGPVGVVEDAF